MQSSILEAVLTRSTTWKYSNTLERFAPAWVGRVGTEFSCG
jgi:hypothetical protein